MQHNTTKKIRVRVHLDLSWCRVPGAGVRDTWINTWYRVGFGSRDKRKAPRVAPGRQPCSLEDIQELQSYQDLEVLAIDQSRDWRLANRFW